MPPARPAGARFRAAPSLTSTRVLRCHLLSKAFPRSPPRTRRLPSRIYFSSEQSPPDTVRTAFIGFASAFQGSRDFACPGHRRIPGTQHGGASRTVGAPGLTKTLPEVSMRR